MRISTYNIPRIICRADFTDDYLALPRGCEDAVTTMLESLGVAYEMIDETNHASLLPLHSRARNVTSNLMPSIP